ncbi:MAG: surface lipoprotein assembly modifier [bacterium]
MSLFSTIDPKLALACSIGILWSIVPAIGRENTAPAPQQMGHPAADHYVNLTADQVLKAAEKLYSDGKLDEAELILAELGRAEQAEFDRNQAVFLKGMIVSKRGEHDRAVEIFDSLLQEQPNLVRVRLEMARSLFEEGRDREAAKNFRLAMASDIPQSMKKTIAVYLQEIDDRRVLRTQFSASIAPNSNINAGAGEDLGVYFFGGFIPFDVNDAPAESGIGLSSSTKLLFKKKLSPRWRLHSSISGRYTDYNRASFDDALLQVEAGPSYQFDNATIKFVATGSMRQFGGDDFYHKYGGRLSLTAPLAQRTNFSINTSLDRVNYTSIPTRNGFAWSVGGGLTHRFYRAARAGVNFNFTREEPNENTLSTLEENNQYSFGIFASHRLPFNFIGYVAPQIFVKSYDDCNPVDFHILTCQNDPTHSRRDIAPSLTLGLVKTDWQILGFSPRVSYNYLDYSSNVDRYAYDRHSVDFGLTRNY